MKKPLISDQCNYQGISEEIQYALKKHGVAILPPLDVATYFRLVKKVSIDAKITILDPWYNKGFGGVRTDYQQFVLSMLQRSAEVSEHVFLWGFPEIIATFVERIPQPLNLVCWLTWYYKNNPSVIRGWRSSQNACLHLAKKASKLFPEHFLNDAQKELKAQGKLRYMPGPTSVIEAALLVGFVGRKEQTGHPSQKPVPVFEKLIMMTTEEGDIVLDPMAGSGTTGEAARVNQRLAIVCDHSEEYIAIMEKRLGLTRIEMNPSYLLSISKRA